MKNILKSYILFLIILLTSFTCFNSCGSLKHVPVKDNNSITIRDSLVIRDSTRLVDSVIYIEIPREKVMEIVDEITGEKAQDVYDVF